MLHFEDDNEATNFLQHYGINDVSSSLSRDGFIEPESSLPVTRSPQLVEGKRTTTLGEVVHGATLLNSTLPEPTSSFDDRGFFIGIIKPPKYEHTGGLCSLEDEYVLWNHSVLL